MEKIHKHLEELEKMLDEWFNSLPAKAVQIVTGIDPSEYPYAPKIVKDDDQTIYKEDILETIQDTWDNFDLEEKTLWKKKLEKIKF